MQQLHVLVMADKAGSRRALRNALEQQHQSVSIQEAKNPAHAGQLLHSELFSCVILSGCFGAGAGLEQLLRLRKAHMDLPVILLTTEDEESLIDERFTEKGLLGAATVTLLKTDLSPSLLGHCLRSVLRFHKLEEKTQRSQETLHLRDRAIAAASNGIVICDARQTDMPIIFCNPAFCEMTGYTPAEMLGRNCRILQGDGTNRQDVQKIHDCVKHGQTCWMVVRNYRKDGTPFWNELTLSPVRDASGTLTHYIGVQNDITERRNAEDALQQNIARQQAVMREMFASVTGGKLALCSAAQELPVPFTQFTDPVPLSATGGIRELRAHAVRACRVAGISEIRLADLELAVGEAAMNAVVHSAAGTGQVFLHERGTVQVRVEDTGGGITLANLPNATLKRGYSTAGTMGQGFKIILSAADRVSLLTSGAGTTVVIEQDRDAPLPAW